MVHGLGQGLATCNGLRPAREVPMDCDKHRGLSKSNNDMVLVVLAHLYKIIAQDLPWSNCSGFDI